MLRLGKFPVTSNFALFALGLVTVNPTPACSCATLGTVRYELLSYTSIFASVILPMVAIPVVPLGANIVRPAPILRVDIPDTLRNPDPSCASKLFAGTVRVANPTCLPP